MEQKYRQKLIKHGYPKSLVKSWSDKYCKAEWNILLGFMIENKLSR